MRSFLAPSGRLTSHQYEAGSWTPGATPGSGVFTPGAGGALRVVTTEGTAAAPNGIAHRTQQNREVMDEYGDSVWQETLVCTDTGYERVAWTEQAFDGRGRAVTTWHSDGTRADAVWDCCGKSSETLPDGQAYSYTYDAIGRLVIKAKENGAVPMLTSHTYDAAGRQLSETISAGGLSLTSSQEYDLAGRVARRTTRDGLVATVTYEDGGRVVSEIHPGGATVQRTSYLDGQQKSLHGTAVVDTWYDYALDSGWI